MIYINGKAYSKEKILFSDFLRLSKLPKQEAIDVFEKETGRKVYIKKEPKQSTKTIIEKKEEKNTKGND